MPRRLTQGDQDRDILADLRSSLHYYDNVAEPDNDPERETQLQNVASKLRQVVKRLENELQSEFFCVSEAVMGLTIWQQPSTPR